jgi:putative Mg2+ transporter-C (MgtC) family protein
MPSFDISWQQMLYNLGLLAIAYLLALPIAWNRERSSQSAGLRTFPLVAMASCGYMLVGIHVLDSTDAEARVIAGLLTGIGFIGGGAILKHRDGVTGTATAASLWNTGLIGMAVAWRRLEIAIVLSLANWLTLWLVPRIKERLSRSD